MTRNCRDRRPASPTNLGLALLVTAVLAGCGGGGGSGSTTQTQPPTQNPPGPGQNPPGQNPPNASLGDTFAITNTNRLITFDRAAPVVKTAAAITGLQAGENIIGFDVRPADGKVFAISSIGSVYTIDTATAAAARIQPLSTLPLEGTDFGIEYVTQSDHLRVVSNTGQSFSFSMRADNSVVLSNEPRIRIGNTNGAQTTATGVTAIAATRNFEPCTVGSRLFYLDTEMDRLLAALDPDEPTVLSAIGGLGVDASAASGFEILGEGSAISAIAALTVQGVVSLYSINLTSGAATPVAAITGLNAGESIVGLAVPPPASMPAVRLGSMLAVTETNKLISFDSNSPLTLCTPPTAITGLQQGEDVLGMDVRPADGLLYALGSSGRIYTIDTKVDGFSGISSSFAVASVKSTLTSMLSGTDFSVDFDPVADRLRVVSDMGMDLSVAVESGEAVTNTVATSGATPTAAAYTNSFPGAGRTTFYVLDTLNNRLAIQQTSASGTALVAVGERLDVLGRDFVGVAGFDINGRGNEALAALTQVNGSASLLYSIDLKTGITLRGDTIGGGERIRALTFAAVPKITLMGITALKQVVTFKPTAPAEINSLATVANLRDDENILGIDLRPSDGLVYALTDAGRLYVLEQKFNTLTNVPTLTASLQDDTGNDLRFTGLRGTSFGVDFNPQYDLLRVVSNQAQNLRVDVDDGTTTEDFTLNRMVDSTFILPLPVGTATAYGRTVVGGVTNTPGAPTTTQYVIDTSTGTLETQTQRIVVSPRLSQPADGRLKLIGALDPTATFTNIAAFDIAGGDDGLALAVLQPTGAEKSTLYSIDLQTGRATALGEVGPENLGPIVAFTILVE